MENLKKIQEFNRALEVVNEKLKVIKDKLSSDNLGILESLELFKQYQTIKSEGDEIIESIESFDKSIVDDARNEMNDEQEEEKKEEEPFLTIKITKTHRSVKANGFTKLELLGVLEETKHNILNNKYEND